MQVDYKTEIAMLEKQIAERNAEAARQETRLVLAVAGLFAAGIAILGFLIRSGG